MTELLARLGTVSRDSKLSASNFGSAAKVLEPGTAQLDSTRVTQIKLYF